MAHLRQKSNSPYWMATFKHSDGRFVERSTKCTERRKAAEIALEWEKAARKARAGELTHAQSMKVLDEMVFDSTGEQVKRESIEELFKRWLESKVARKQVSTANRYRPILNGFLASIGARRAKAIVGSVTPLEITKYRDLQLEEGKSPTTADFALKVLSAAFEVAHKEGQSLTNPCHGVERLNEAAEERDPFTDEQILKLLVGASQDWKGMILLSYHTGIRLNDAANLVYENIDVDGQTLTYIAAKTARKRKSKNDKTEVYLHSEFIEWLNGRPVGIGRAPIFPSLHGKPTGSAGGLSNTFAALMVSVGVVAPLGEKKTEKGRQFRKLSFHSLRHSFISRLANADVSADVRKEMAGHSSDAVHRRYTHLDVSAQKRAMDRLPSVVTER